MILLFYDSESLAHFESSVDRIMQKQDIKAYLVSIQKWLFSAISASDSDFNPPEAG